MTGNDSSRSPSRPHYVETSLVSGVVLVLSEEKTKLQDQYMVPPKMTYFVPGRCSSSWFGQGEMINSILVQEKYTARVPKKKPSHSLAAVAGRFTFYY